MNLNKEARYLITGGSGLVGAALTQFLKSQGCTNIKSVGSKDCDLRDEEATNALFREFKPDYVFHLAARVHGLGGNSIYKADILVENVQINLNVIKACRTFGVRKVVAMGSGCVYPVFQEGLDLTEDMIWDGAPHGSEDSYAHAKRLMLAHLEAEHKQYGLDYAFVISGNLYGPNDKFNNNEGHVTPSLIKKFHDALTNHRKATVWGHGVAIRDFTFSEDVAEALCLILLNATGPINMGSSQKHAIKDIVDALQEITGVEVEWDTTKPDGQRYRCYDTSKLQGIGFTAKTSLKEGIAKTWDWYVQNCSQVRS